MYDVEHVVFKPKNMTPDQLQAGLYRAWKETYRPLSILKRISGTASIFPVILSLNLGYKYYAGKLHEYTRDIMLEGGLS